MLLLGSKTITVEGITVFPDHADPAQFWYLPGPVSLARRDDGQAVFTFIKYKPAAVAGGAKGGGFLMFEVNLRLNPTLERRITAKLASFAKGKPKLAVVPFDEGTVQCVALNLQGPGGTAAAAVAPGSFNAVEKILGASVPSLHGDNSAVFSLTLSQEGATILEKAFEQGTEPVGVIYDLKFTGMRPSLNVKITADFKRIYEQLSGSVSAQIYYVSAGIDAAFEKLVQDGAIKIEVIDFTGEADQKEKEEWALNFFKEKLLTEWFQPSLPPGQIAGGFPQPESLDNVLRRGSPVRPPATTTPAKPTGAPPAPAARPGPAPTEKTGKGAAPTGLNATPPAAHDASQSPTEGTGAPVTPTAVPPAAGTGLNFTPSKGNLPAGVGQAAGAGSGSGIGGTPLVSFKLRFVHQEELKTVTLEYNRSEATQRTYAPQGFFGLLVADLQKDKHFIEVDLDDAFFRVFGVSADAPIDFARIGLTSAQLALDYGNPADPATLKHADFIFDADHRAQNKFDVFMNSNLDTSYTYAAQYHFDPLSGWEGSKFSYDLPARRTEDRTLFLNPFESLGFLEIQALSHRVDWGVLDSIDVALHYQSSSGQQQDTTLLLTESEPNQSWKLRLDNPAERSYSYQIVYHMKDGSLRTSEPIISRATMVPVDDPFPAAIEIEFVPLYDPKKVKMVFIDIEYADLDNHYQRAERLRLESNASDSVRQLIAVIDPSKLSYRYRLTFVGTDNSMHRGPFNDTTETLIGVSQ